MKRSEVWVFLGVLGILVSVARLFIQYPSLHTSIFETVSVGAGLGLLFSFFVLSKFRPQTKKIETILGVTTITALFFFGLSFLQYSQQYKTATDDVKGWKMTRGKITGHDIYESPPTKIHSRGRFAPTWQYVYSAGGKNYAGHSTQVENAYALDFFILSSDAVKAGQKRPVGSEVDVYYDPAKPERSVLDRAMFVKSYELILQILGAVVCLISVAGLWAVLKKIRTLK